MNEDKGHRSLTVDSQGLFEQRKRANTAPGTLADLLKDKQEEEGTLGYHSHLRHTFIDVKTTSQRHKDGNVSSTKDKVAAYNKKVQLKGLHIQVSLFHLC